LRSRTLYHQSDERGFFATREAQQSHERRQKRLGFREDCPIGDYWDAEGALPPGKAGLAALDKGERGSLDAFAKLVGLVS
jgi:hypothetical protein